MAFPKRYGKYILVRKIATGGMAEVFRAKHFGAEGFEKDLVIKRILPHFSEDEDFVKMFIDEATIAAKLQHANIVQIYDFDTVDETYYIAMEYVEGKDLKEIVSEGIKRGQPLSPAHAVWITMEVCKGLHYAHMRKDKGQALNIIHRDVSPHNVMISFTGDVKLMDFGIAKAASRSTKTVAGRVKGKTSYMSPEQAQGFPLDGRSDLFALGVVLWEMLTQKRLFAGESDFATLTAVLKQESPPPSAINPAVPKELDEICLKALQKKADARHKNVEEFGRELTRWYYANVDDLDEASLKPWMQRTFASEISELQQQFTKEQTMLVKAMEDDPDTAQVAAMARGVAAPVQNDERTMALPAAGEDVLYDPPEAEPHGGPVRHDAATKMVSQFTPEADDDDGYSAPPRQGRGLMMVAILALVLVGGGLAAYFATQGDDEPGPEVEQVAESPKEEPRADPQDDEDEDDPTQQERPEADAEGKAPAAEADASVEADAEAAQADAGPGEQADTAVAAADAGAAGEADGGGEPSAQAAEFFVSVSPEDAMVAADKGTLKPADGGIVIGNLTIGDKVQVEFKRAGYEDLEVTLDITEARGLKKFTMERERPKGSGHIKVNARPWADCQIRGHGGGRTPFTKKVQAGRHLVICKQGDVRKTRGVTVRNGQTKNVVLDMRQ